MIYTDPAKVRFEILRSLNRASEFLAEQKTQLVSFWVTGVSSIEIFMIDRPVARSAFIASTISASCLPGFVHSGVRPTLEAYLNTISCFRRMAVNWRSERKLRPSFLRFLPDHTSRTDLFEFRRAAEANLGEHLIVECRHCIEVVRSDHDVTEHRNTPAKSPTLPHEVRFSKTSFLTLLVVADIRTACSIGRIGLVPSICCTRRHARNVYGIENSN